MADDEFWNPTRRECRGCEAVWPTTVPAGLAKAAGLKGLSCGLTQQSLRSALDLLPRLAHLEILSLGCGSKLGRADLQALSSAHPGVHIRSKSCDDPKVGSADPRYALSRKIGCANSYDEAAAAAEQLFADMNFAKPRFETEFQESALKGWLRTLTDVAARERKSRGATQQGVAGGAVGRSHPRRVADDARPVLAGPLSRSPAVAFRLPARPGQPSPPPAQPRIRASEGPARPRPTGAASSTRAIPALAPPTRRGNPASARGNSQVTIPK